MYVIFHFKHHIFFLVIMIGTYTGTDEIICIPKRRNKFFKTNSTKKKKKRTHPLLECKAWALYLFTKDIVKY